MIKGILRAVTCAIVIFLVIFGIVFIDVKLDKALLEKSGYEIIEYVNSSYKVFDRETRVVYIYSVDSHVFSPMYNSDGSLLIY